MQDPINTEIVDAIKRAQTTAEAIEAAKKVKAEVQADPDDLALSLKAHFGGKPFYRSKKFWASVLGAVLPVAIQAVTGAVTWPVAVGMAVASGIAYILAQGGVDKVTAEAAGDAANKIITAKIAKGK